ncbi:MAG TPA: hypothetical protein VMT62_11165 [Syntrophorhabdaceae bacterium]|nr:hypothetical protein [Syntrophorhabdaceae bacterium]
MHTRQYSRQQEKRNRIGNGTLVIGVDIGSDFNAACFAYSALWFLSSSYEKVEIR